MNSGLLLVESATGIRGEVVFEGSTNGIIDTLWTCPAGVFFVSALCVAAGGHTTNGNARGGGALSYKNAIPVVPGQTYRVYIDRPSSGGGTFFISNTTVFAPGTTTQNGGGAVAPYRVGDGGGNGGAGGTNTAGGGGGAGGYSGSGGSGGSNSAPNSQQGGAAGSGGGGGGGAAGFDVNNYPYEERNGGGGGGGVGLYGEGTSGGPSNVPPNNSTPSPGNPGSNGQSRAGETGEATLMSGGLYGGATGGRGYWSNADTGTSGNFVAGTVRGMGALRLVWPGDSRTFPSNDVGLTT